MTVTNLKIIQRQEKKSWKGKPDKNLNVSLTIQL